MPPAFILSHDQTLKFMSNFSPGGMPRTKASISRSRSAQNSIHVWKRVKDMYEQLGFNRSSDALMPPETGAAAHMSLHLNHYVKERKRPTPQPTPFSRGDLCAWFLMTASPFRVDHRCGGAASMPGF
jgi:hypothetical protein